MQCAYPKVGSFGIQYGCRQCMPCRINLQRQKVSRFLLERAVWRTAAFVTWTYAPEHLPVDAQGRPVLCRPHAKAALRKLRDLLKARGREFSFALVGEYGTQFGRPHYHALLFGLDPLGDDELLVSVWPWGLTHVGEVTRKSASYVAHYTTKKLTKAEAEGLDGRPPEFLATSRRPALGARYMAELEGMYRQPGGELVIKGLGDLSPVVRVEGRVWPLDRWFAQKLRERLGIPLRAAERKPKPRREPKLTAEQAVRVHEKLRRKARCHGVM